MKFVTFGEPVNGKSINHYNNSMEEGVSCFKVEDNKIILDTRAQVAIFNLVAIDQKRDIYEVFGEEIGEGQDGEPVIEMESYEFIGEPEFDDMEFDIVVFNYDNGKVVSEKNYGNLSEIVSEKIIVR